MYSIAFPTIPLFLLGVLEMADTSCSLWAALNDCVNGLMDLLWCARLEFRLSTDCSGLFVLSKTCEALAMESRGGSVQGTTPIMRLLPKTRPFRARAFCACILVWKRIFIQFPLGGMKCCNTVPPKMCEKIQFRFILERARKTSYSLSRNWRPKVALLQIASQMWPYTRKMSNWSF